MALVKGTRLSNTLTGTAADDFIYAFLGNDTITSGAGNDLVFAGKGNDRVFGGAGNDTIFGDAGRDTLSGGDGNDIIDGREANTLGKDPGTREVDQISAGAGADIVHIDERDVALGGAGLDTLDLGRIELNTSIALTVEVFDFGSIRERWPAHLRPGQGHGPQQRRGSLNVWKFS